MKTLFFLLSFSAMTIVAQDSTVTDSKADRNNFFLIDYQDMLTEKDYFLNKDSLVKGLAEDFFTLRMSYTKTALYSPYSIDESDRAKAIVSELNKENYQNAVDSAVKALEYDYTNSNIHLYLGYAYRMLGDSVRSNYHYACERGLIESIKLSGDGVSYQTAFVVTSTSEEYRFLRYFNLAAKEQSLEYFDKYSFDVQTVVDDEGNEYDYYFNITIPLTYLNNKFK